MHSSYVAVPIACDALNAQAVAVREYHYLTAQVIAIKEDKSFT
ncbi:conjugal transfer protein [Blautia producta]|uniref:Conjugal transfer protein n=1 Tax=Blautia producta TaxID=33035 RepID=A0A7G5N360_9FIRM|nr:conjugal transfer protein [Blautia producta]